MIEKLLTSVATAAPHSAADVGKIAIKKKEKGRESDCGLELYPHIADNYNIQQPGTVGAAAVLSR
jgi:hypothetical protein